MQSLDIGEIGTNILGRSQSSFTLESFALTLKARRR